MGRALERAEDARAYRTAVAPDAAASLAVQLMGFFADVRELRARMQAQLDQGAGSKALINAVAEGPLGKERSKQGGKTQVLKPDLPTHADLNKMIDDLPDRISTDQLKDLLARGAVVKGRKK